MYFSSFEDLGDVWSGPDVYDEGPQDASRAAMQNKNTEAWIPNHMHSILFGGGNDS